MATLYAENVPDKLYDALRDRARRNRRSMAAELIGLLEENLPTREELARRSDLYNRALRIRARRPAAQLPFVPAEESLREDRLR